MLVCVHYKKAFSIYSPRFVGFNITEAGTNNEGKNKKNVYKY